MYNTGNSFKSVDDSFKSILDKFQQPEEVAEYASVALRGLHPWENKVVKEYLSPPANILDIGCGCGREAIPLSEMGFSVIAIDLVPAMIEFACNLASQKNLHITAKVMNACKLDFPDNFFDAVLMLEQFLGTIPGVVNRDAALKEAWRVLKPGGILIMSCISKNRSLSRYLFWKVADFCRYNSKYPALEKGDLLRKKVDGAISKGKIAVHYFTLQEGIDLFKKNGFEICKTSSVHDYLHDLNKDNPGFQGEKDYALLFVGKKTCESWNAFTKENTGGHIFQSASWALLEKKRGFSSFQLAVSAASNENEKVSTIQPYGIQNKYDIIAGISILSRKIPGSNKVIFYAPRGPVISQKVSKESYYTIIALLMEKTKEFAKEKQAVFLKVDPAVPHDDPLEQALLNCGFSPAKVSTVVFGTQPVATLRLSLNLPLDKIFADFHHKHRQYIRKSQRDGVVIRKVTPSKLNKADEWQKLIRCLCKWQVGGVSKTPEFYNELFSVFSKEAILFVGEKETGEIAAMRILITWGDKAWEFYAVRNPDLTDTRANYLLVWEMIKTAKELGCRWYDFRGVPVYPDPSNHLYGIYRFKAGFGGKVHEFARELDLVFNPTWYNLWNIALSGLMFTSKIKKFIVSTVKSNHLT